MSPTLSIIVPCYNEAANLSALLARFAQAIGSRKDVELILVNNGSRDQSAAVLTELVARPEYRFARVVDVPVNQGYGFGIMSGLFQARGQYLSWTHADLQTDPADVLKGLALLLTSADPARCLVRGRRMGRPWLDRAFTTGMGWISSLALRTPLHDINAQPKIFHRDLLAAMNDAPDDFSLDLFLLYTAWEKKLIVLEQPVHFADRQHGEAKGGGTLRGKVKLTRRTLAYIFALRARLRKRSQTGTAVPTPVLPVHRHSDRDSADAA